MNIYYAVTNYHLLWCILHSMKYHANENNILYINGWHPNYKKLMIKLEKLNFFNKVKVFREVSFVSGNNKIDNNQINSDIDYILKHIPQTFINDVKKSNNIYILGDHYCSSVYLVKNKIKYNYVEDACGVLSDENRLMKIIKESEYSRYQIMNKLKLPGKHSYIINRYGDLNNQLSGYKNSKDIHFSVSETLEALSYDEIYKIVSVFSDSNFSVPNDSNLVLTFHYVNMNLLTMLEQKLLYYYLIDYFLECDAKKIVIKQHPSDMQPDYKKWFPKSLILPRQLPSELLPFLSKQKYNKIITAYSTSIFAFKKYCNNIISFNSTIEKDFKAINKYYFLLKVVSSLGLNDYNMYCIGLNDSIVNNIIDKYNIDNLNVYFVDKFEEVPNIENRVIVFERKNNNLKNNLINENDMVFYLDSFESFKILDEDDNKVMLVLHKKLIDTKRKIEDYFLNDEYILLYCLNKEILSKIKKIEVSKKLNLSNININLEFVSSSMYYQKKQLIDLLNDNIKNLNNELIIEKNKNIDLTSSFEELINSYNIMKDNNNIEIDKYRNSYEYYKNKYEEVINSSSWKLTKIYRKIGYIIKKMFRR